MSDLALAATIGGQVLGTKQKATSNMINAAGTAANALKGSLSNGGSSAKGWSQSTGYSDSWSNVAGNIASERSRLNALEANASARDAWETAAEYNSQQAAINRAWQEYMSNTQYQRAVQDMKKAGINPILAAGNGLSSASIGSGATASMSAPETFMGQSMAEQNSASHSENSSKSENSSSSWEHSESGLATGLKLMGEAVTSALSGLNSSITINNTLDSLKDLGLNVSNEVEDIADTAVKQGKGTAEKVVGTVKNAGNKAGKAASNYAKTVKTAGKKVENSYSQKAKHIYNKAINKGREIAYHVMESARRAAKKG